MDMRKQALEEERKRREELEKRLQEETNRRQKLIEREVKLREKQRAQVGEKNIYISIFMLMSCCFAQNMVLISAALLLRINLPNFFDKAFSHVPEANFPPLHAYFPLLRGFNQACADSSQYNFSSVPMPEHNCWQQKKDSLILPYDMNT